MGSPKHSCRTCDHYRRRHDGGPTGYGFCELRSRPAHGNETACDSHPELRPPAGSRTHVLKTWPAEFQATVSGVKTFEFRRDDRGFSVGDVLVLREWRPADPVARPSVGGYTKRELRVRVRYILRDPMFGVPDGFVVMSIAPERSGRGGGR